MKKLADLLLEPIKRRIYKSWIRGDCYMINNSKVHLLAYPEENFEVVEGDGDYLDPKTTSLVLPIKHPDGLFMYYDILSESLNALLHNRQPKIKTFKSSMPDHVSKFIVT